MGMLNLHTQVLAKIKKLSLMITIAFIAFIVVIIATMIYKAPHLKGVGFSKDGISVEYYDTPRPRPDVIKDRPAISVYPKSFTLSYPNPASPSSLHGTFTVNIENTGAVNALISDIRWKIVDGERSITPPNEWRKIIGEPKVNKFYLSSFTGMRYIYGPEIGSSGKNKISLVVEVKYKNPRDKSGITHTAYYAGSLNYDRNIKMKYAGDEFVSITRSSNE
ncbi:MAG: hypothetical protein NG740_06100 [Omnitrophica bacterium]|nr:hypothetical protein [Candidatus Omnitrophota bacterium]